MGDQKKTICRKKFPSRIDLVIGGLDSFFSNCLVQIRFNGVNSGSEKVMECRFNSLTLFKFPSFIYLFIIYIYGSDLECSLITARVRGAIPTGAQYFNARWAKASAKSINKSLIKNMDTHE